MSEVSYDRIAMDMVATLEYHKRPVYDGPNYTFTEVYFRFRTVLNPAATSYAAGPRLAAGQKAQTTDAAIRHALSQPRRKLIVKQAGVTILESPQPGYLTDAANGPFPELFDLHYNAAEKTWIADWGVTVRVNECPVANVIRGGVGRSPVLSHLWSQQHSFDEHFFSVRMTAGHLILRTDEMLLQRVTPDMFRAALFPSSSIPVNFQRQSADISVSEDGSRIDYRVVDIERAINIDEFALSRNVVDIKATHDVFIGRPAPDDIRAGVAAQQGPALFGAAFAVAGGRPVSGLSTLVSSAIGSVSPWLQVIPRTRHVVAVVIFGNRNATKAGLESVAHRLIDDRLRHTRDSGGSVYQHVRWDMAGKYVEVDLQWETSLVTAARQFGAADLSDITLAAVGPLGNQAAFQRMVAFQIRGTVNMPQAEAVLEILNPEDVVGNPEPPGPGSQGTRGTYVGQLVAQALSSPCALPAAPPPDAPAVNFATLG